MKKNLVLLLCFLLVTLLGFSQRAKTVTVSVLGEKDAKSVAPLLAQLKNEVRAVVGQNATVVFNPVLYHNYDTAIARVNYQKTLDNNTDIIIAFGLVNTVLLYKEKSYPKPTIVFGAINSDFIDIPKNQKTSGVDNITYLFTPSSYAEDLATFESLSPYQNVGIIMDDFIIESLPVRPFFDTYFKEKSSTYELIALDENGHLEHDLTNLDAVYLAGGTHLNQASFKALVNKINAMKIPSFSGFRRKDVVNGVLAGNRSESNLDQFFRRISLNIEAIVAGQNASTLPLHIDYANSLVINTNTAKTIGFSLRYSLLASSELIGENRSVKTEMSYSITDIMKTVVGENLGLTIAKKNIDLANQEIKNAKSNYLPGLDASANALYLDPKVAEVSNGQNPEFSTSGSQGH